MSVILLCLPPSCGAVAGRARVATGDVAKDETPWGVNEEAGPPHRMQERADSCREVPPQRRLRERSLGTPQVKMLQMAAGADRRKRGRRTVGGTPVVDGHRGCRRGTSLRDAKGCRRCRFHFAVHDHSRRFSVCTTCGLDLEFSKSFNPLLTPHVTEDLLANFFDELQHQF